MTDALQLAKKLFGINNIRSFVPIRKINGKYIRKYKIVVFVPSEKTDELTYAMSSEGAGRIGNYSLCSFRTKGTGTFKGGKRTKPYAGKKGRFEKIDEIRLEMICGKNNLNRIIRKMLEVHPYEEPAYEIYEVLVKENKLFPGTIKVELKKPVSLSNLFKKINKELVIDGYNKSFSAVKVKKAVIDFSASKKNTDSVLRLMTQFKKQTKPDKLLYISVPAKNKRIINLKLI